MNYVSAPWIWLYVGAFLMLLEVVTPGFVVFFFGLSACTVAILRFVFADLSLAWQLALFSVFAILYLAVLRRLLRNVFSGAAEKVESHPLTDDFAGRVGTVVASVRPGIPGRVLLGDAEWAAACDCALEPGDAVRVVRQDNLTLHVQKV